jgi:cytochrome P450
MATPISHEVQETVEVTASAAIPLKGRHAQLSSFARYREKRRFWSDPVGYMSQRYSNEGVLSAFGAQQPEYVFAFAPELNKQLNENAALFHWSAGRKWTRPSSSLSILRASIGNMDGQEYQIRKTLMRPAFHHDVIEGARDKMVSRTDEMLSRWSGNGVRDVHLEIRKLVHAISMAAVLGVEEQSVVDSIYQLVDDIYTGSGRPLAMLLPYDLPLLPFRKVTRTADEMVELLRSIIQQKRRDGSVSCDMLSMMMHSKTEQGVSLSETELVSEIYNIMGHDTTISGLIWMLILIAIHPKAQAKLVEELSGRLRGGAPTLADLNQLPYLDAAIKEGMRLMPPQCFSRRFNVEPCRLGHYDLPARTTIFMSSYITHRLPNLYSQPLRFIPERWDMIKPGSYEYFPFGSGVHYCVGRAFALLEMKIVLAMTLQRYKLSFAPGQRIDRMPGARLLLSPKGAVAMKIEKHDGRFSSSRVRGDISQMIALS